MGRKGRGLAGRGSAGWGPRLASVGPVVAGPRPQAAAPSRWLSLVNVSVSFSPLEVLPYTGAARTYDSPFDSPTRGPVSLLSG